jgi:hypothetical protein
VPPNTIHTFPINDLIDHLTGEGEECPCGPTVVPVERVDGSIGYHYQHHSLDGREFQEFFECPVCKMKSYHPQDIAFGYCGNCHAFTKGEVSVDQDPVVIADNVWNHLPWPAQVIAVVVLVLVALGLLWLLIFGEI